MRGGRRKEDGGWRKGKMGKMEDGERGRWEMEEREDGGKRDGF